MREAVAGFTSTGSKRPEALFGGAVPGTPEAMLRASGCRVWDAEGREYLDLVMALGAVALGYGHPAVTEAAVRAVRGRRRGTAASRARGGAGRRSSGGVIPWMERVRFLKTGAEAMAAAVRLARTVTGRDAVLGCGYHGWLDWCQGAEHRRGARGRRARSTRRSRSTTPPARASSSVRAGDALAAVVFEPVILGQPDPEWLAVLREETARSGAILIVDEIKTVGRLALGGASERYGIRPDLVVIGKAIANGFPLAAVGGRAEVMAAVGRTWISSTLATELVSLAAAQGHARCDRRRTCAGAPRPRRRASARGPSRTGRAPPATSCAGAAGSPRCAACSSTRRPTGAGARGSGRARRASLQALGLQLRLAGARRRGGGSGAGGAGGRPGGGGARPPLPVWFADRHTRPSPTTALDCDDGCSGAAAGNRCRHPRSEGAMSPRHKG